MREAFRLTVRVVPQGGKDQLENIVLSPSGDIFLKARVKAPPEDGKANAAVTALLATLLKVPKCDVILLKGHKVRLKIFAVEGDPAVLKERLLNLP